MRIHVTNLNGSIAGKLLEEACKAIGDCQVRIYNTHAYVEFSQKDLGEQALSVLNGREIGGKTVIAEVKPPIAPISSTPTPFAQKPQAKGRSRSRSPVKEDPAVVHLPSFKPIQTVGVISLPTVSASPATLPQVEISIASQSAPKTTPPALSPKLPVPAAVDHTNPANVQSSGSRPDLKAVEQLAKAEEEVKGSAGEEFITFEGEKFKVVELNKNDEMTCVMCIVCSKNIQKRTIKNHIGTRSHKQATKK
jgi:hypothetical protein